jgi:diaminohydroxyphosphoribosylaminopyrimidine deaminase/5-amino-6-(5-phosphoribosylamino)uracil reductase
MAERGVVVDVGVGADEARRAHAGHIRRMRDGRPHVTLKLAVSADGKAGLAGHRPAMITGEAARERVQLMRAMNDAVLTGIGTVHADDPNLNCRLNGMANRSPVRVILDSDLTMPLDSKLAATAREVPVWVMAAAHASAAAERPLQEKGLEVIRTRRGEGGLDLSGVLQLLGDHGITRVMVEAGPRVSAAFLRADLVDAAVLFRGPDNIGTDGIDALDGLPLTALTQSPSLKSLGVEPVGADQVEIFERV